MFGLGNAADFEDEIGDNSDVQNDEKGSCKRGVVKELINFERDEARSGNDSEEFGPALAQPKANTFREEETGIDKSAEAEGAEFVLVHCGQSFEQEIQKMIMGINAEKIGPMLCLHDKILIGEHVRSDADGEKQESFEKFERGDEHKTARMFAEFGHRGSKIVTRTQNNAQLRIEQSNKIPREFLMTDTQQNRGRR